MQINHYLFVKEDALEFLKKQPDESIKLVITSPPYNIGKSYETKTSLTQYLANLKPIIAETCRTLARDGSICWEVGNYVDPDTGEVFPLDIYYYQMFKDMGLRLRNRIIWHFGHGLQCENRFSGRYETIMWFTKGDHYTFNLDDVRIPAKYPGKKAYKGKKKGQLSGNPKGKNPEDVWEATVERLYDDWDAGIWEVPNVNSNHREKTIHPCQFPVELAERCVLALTNENEIVYDPFAGVGSTLIAALKNNRRAYGTELQQEYIDIGNERIEKLRKDILKTRPIYQRIYVPSGKDAVSTYPTEWLENRLNEVEQTKKDIQKEVRDLKKEISKRKLQITKGETTMMKLVLLRHGESEWNKLNLFTGWMDVDLSDKGREEAKAAGQTLKAAGYDFDVCYTSYLKRAIHTLNITLDEMDRAWLPVIKSWKLNERHYGALQGLNKAETAEKYGEEQVKIWRRSFDVKPPELDPNDDRSANKAEMYRGVDPKLLPANESLETTIERVIPYFEEVIKPDMKAGKRVVIAAHGNSLRALVKYFDNLTPDEILGVNIPTAVPLVYEFDDDFKAVKHYYLGDQDAIAAKMQAVANQGKKK